MYSFIDTTEVSEGVFLPSEALQINGNYIENLIPGYRTLSVSGRELLFAEIDSYETGIRDGAKIKYRRFPPRQLVIRYQLIADSDSAFREAYNSLAALLNVENATLIFADEPDKYYLGTPYEIGDAEPGTNAITSEFSILCTDPFKYSVSEYTAEASPGESSILIDYKGTYKSYPILEADFYNEAEVGEDGDTPATPLGAGDCGFVAFFNEGKKIIQIGNPSEVNTQSHAASQTLINQPFNTVGAWGTTSKSLWTVNSGKPTPLTTSQVGQPGMKSATFLSAGPASTSKKILTQTINSTPPYSYEVTAKASNRTANSVKVDVTVTLNITDTAKIPSSGTVMLSIYMGGSWHNGSIVFRKTDMVYYVVSTGSTTGQLAPYKPTPKSYTTSISFTVTGLSGTTNVLSGIQFKAVRVDSPTSYGAIDVNCANLPISEYGTKDPAGYHLGVSSYGTGTGWHGAVITRPIPQDSGGATGATNFSLTYAQIFCSAASSEIGSFQMTLTDANNASVAAVVIYKNKAGNSGKIEFYVNGVKQYGTDRDLSYYNQFFGATTKSNKSTAIHKTGSKIIFNVGGIQKTFTVAAIANKAVTHITFAFAKWSSNAALTYNGIYNLKFVKNNCDTMTDIPNKFSANDIMEADCNDGTIKVNNVLSPELGALGNDWEQFCLTPGLNQIGFAYSDWVEEEYAPKIKIRYREVFI